MKQASHSHEFREFLMAASMGLSAGLMTWLVAYSLALLFFPQITGIHPPRLLTWL
jgi:hypothetical protein